MDDGVSGTATAPSEGPQLSRQHTDEKSLLPSTSGVQSGPQTTTPQRVLEGKRRRVTPDSSEALGHAGDDDAHASTSSAAQNRALAKSVEDILREHLQSWALKLVQLQPKVFMNQYMVEGGLWLFKYLRQLQASAALEGSFPAAYLANEQLLIHDLIACWWVVLKHCSIRTAVPNRTLLCRATGANAELLADREVAALIAVDWDVTAALRLGGFDE